MGFELEGFLGNEADLLMKETLKKYDAWFILAYNINRLINKHKETLSITTDQAKEIILMSLYIKISNHYQSVILLLKKGLSVESDILIRSMLETLLPLKLIVTDETFFKEFIRNDKASTYRLYNVILKEENKHLFNFISFEDEKKRDELMAEISPYYKDGKIRTLSAEELAKRADMNLDYQLTYRYLSGYVHSSLETLEKAYLIIEDSELQAFNLGHNTQSFDRILFSVMYYILCSFDFMEQHFNTGLRPRMERYIETLLKLRSELK
ncbi:DUF5677 domain-containing protein [Paenibacillus wynnii]|uniref:DUF5677 domain-containing protein n=1 Tax=Paenibacillus wynnii TaxID=268407 RepID=UPI00278CFEED|nr:DUF5677 domain-containing protein [Paenibacillus wynnii]MDQ0195361.1 hypothetical protein [Paenibacillus wynnii]